MQDGRRYGLTRYWGSPTLSASLEYFKYCGGKHLPTQFMEAELDYFGSHNYDLKSEGEGEVKKGESIKQVRRMTTERATSR